MVNFCLNDKEKLILKSLIGKKLLMVKRDPLDTFGNETVYGRIDLFFTEVIVLVDYDYSPCRLFGGEDDDHPKFVVKIISQNEAISALSNVEQIFIKCNEVIEHIKLVEDYADVEWDGKSDSFRTTKAIIFGFSSGEVALQGDYMMPLLDVIKGGCVFESLDKPGEEFDNDPDTKYTAKRFCIDL